MGTRTVFLTSHKDGNDFAKTLKTFIRAATEAVQKSVDFGGLEDYQQELAELKGESASILYFTRQHRDQKLAEGFATYPKGSYNSEAQIALSRQFASTEIRSHELVKDLVDAINTRISINRQQLDLHRNER